MRRLSTQAASLSANQPVPTATNLFPGYNPPPPPASNYAGATGSAAPPLTGYYAGDATNPPPGYYVGASGNAAPFTSAGYYDASASPPRRNWGLAALIFAPLLLIGILVLVYSLFVGSAISKFGEVSSVINGGSSNSLIPDGCHYQDKGGNALRSELSAAIATMCNTNSFHIVLDGRLDNSPISVSGDFSRGEGQFSAHAVGVTYQARVIGNQAYISSDGQKWVSDSTGQVRNVVVFAALFDLIPSDFSDSLQDQGHEQLLGGKAAHKIGAISGGAGTLLGPGASGTVTFWVVNDQGRKAVRQLQVNGKLGAVNGVAYSGSFYIEYSKFNLPVNVSAPTVSGDSNPPYFAAPTFGVPTFVPFMSVSPVIGP